MPRLGQESGRGIALFVAAVMVATGTPALAAPAGNDAVAQPSEEDARAAKQLAGDGRELFFKEEYRAAIKAFESAYALVPDPNLLFNISTAYEKLQDYDRAIEYLDKYGAEAPESEAAGIEKKRRQLLEHKQAYDETLRPPPVVDDVSPALVPPGEGPAPAPDPIPEPEPGPERKPIIGPLGWSLAGVSVVGLGLGIGFGLSSRQASSDGEAACGTVDGMRLCPASARADLDRARNRALVADVAFGVSAAAAIATAVLVGVRLSKRNKDRRADVALTGTGAQLRLRF